MIAFIIFLHGINDSTLTYENNSYVMKNHFSAPLPRPIIQITSIIVPIPNFRYIAQPQNFKIASVDGPLYPLVCVMFPVMAFYWINNHVSCITTAIYYRPRSKGDNMLGSVPPSVCVSSIVGPLIVHPRYIISL